MSLRKKPFLAHFRPLWFRRRYAQDKPYNVFATKHYYDGPIVIVDAPQNPALKMKTVMFKGELPTVAPYVVQCCRIVEEKKDVYVCVNKRARFTFELPNALLLSDVAFMYQEAMDLNTYSAQQLEAFVRRDLRAGLYSTTNGKTISAEALKNTSFYQTMFASSVALSRITMEEPGVSKLVSVCMKEVA